MIVIERDKLTIIKTRKPSEGFTEFKRRFMADFDLAMCTLAMGEYDGNVSQASRSLGLERAHLHKIMKRVSYNRGIHGEKKSTPELDSGPSQDGG